MKSRFRFLAFILLASTPFLRRLRGTKVPDMRFLVRKEIQSIRDIYETERNEGGLMTGFENLDSMTNGLRGGEMIVIAGHPCMGKTALASNLVENIATRKENPAACAFFSLEMTSASLVQRLLCSHATVLTSVLIGGFVSKGRLARVTEAAAFLGDAPIWIDDTAGPAHTGPFQ